MDPCARPQHPHAEQNDSGSEPVYKPCGTSQQPSTQDNTGSDHTGGSQFRGPHWQGPNVHDQEHYHTNVNMHYEEDHDRFMEDYHATRLEHPIQMDSQHLRLPPQMANNQHLVQHPQQYGLSGFGGRGRGSCPQYQGYVHPYESAGYYGHHRFGCGPLENGDDSEQFSEGNPLCRQYPSEGHGFWVFVVGRGGWLLYCVYHHYSVFLVNRGTPDLVYYIVFGNKATPYLVYYTVSGNKATLYLAYCTVSCRQGFVIIVFQVNRSIYWPSTMFLVNGAKADLA